MPGLSARFLAPGNHGFSRTMKPGESHSEKPLLESPIGTKTLRPQSSHQQIPSLSFGSLPSSTPQRFTLILRTQSTQVRFLPTQPRHLSPAGNPSILLPPLLSPHYCFLLTSFEILPFSHLFAASFHVCSIPFLRLSFLFLSLAFLSFILSVSFSLPFFSCLFSSFLFHEPQKEEAIFTEFLGEIKI